MLGESRPLSSPSSPPGALQVQADLGTGAGPPLGPGWVAVTRQVPREDPRSETCHYALPHAHLNEEFT